MMHHTHPTTPHTQPLPGLTRTRFSLIRYRSPLHTESQLFSSPAGTEMFHFPTSPPERLCIHPQVAPHNWYGVSPFGHPRINASLATPRGLTQPHTSFIGPACQGIHHTPVTHTTPTHPNKKRHASMTTYTSSQHELTTRAREPRQTHTSQKRKMLASTIQFSHNTHDTPHTPQPGSARSTPQQQGHTCCPRHPTAHQHIQKRFVCGDILAASTPPYATNP